MTNDLRVIVKYRWRSGVAVSLAVGSWWNLGGGSGGKDLKKFWSFYIWRANE